MVAGVDVAAGHHAVDLADDVAVAEVQLGLGEVAQGLESLRLGLPDRRGLRHHPLQDPIDVPLLVAAGELVEGLLGRLGDGDEGEADLRHALVHFGQRLADPGEGLVDVGGDVRQLSSRGCGARPSATRASWTSSRACLTAAAAVRSASRAGRRPRGRARCG